MAVSKFLFQGADGLANLLNGKGTVGRSCVADVVNVTEFKKYVKHALLSIAMEASTDRAVVGCLTGDWFCRKKEGLIGTKFRAKDLLVIEKICIAVPADHSCG